MLFLLLLLPIRAFAFEPGENYGFLSAGATSAHNYQAAAGLEYLHLVEKTALGYGFRVDSSFSSPSTQIYSAPASLFLSSPHAALNLRIFAGPGLRIDQGKAGFAFLLGIGRYFELGSSKDWHLIPQIAVDVATKAADTFFGLQIGRKF